MTYHYNELCRTPECAGTPFYGETLRPGYCDSCHVDRVTAAEMVDRLEAEYTANEHSDRYWDLRDDLIAYGDTHPGARPIIDGAGYPIITSSPAS